MRSAALTGRAGEMLVAAELMRRGIEIAQPASDVGVDLLAYRLDGDVRTATRFVPIQVKAFSGSGYRFMRSWFNRAPGLALVVVNNLVTTPRCYVFRDLQDVEEALKVHAQTRSWTERGIWSATEMGWQDASRMLPFLDRWERITGQLST